MCKQMSGALCVYSLMRLCDTVCHLAQQPPCVRWTETCVCVQELNQREAAPNHRCSSVNEVNEEYDKSQTCWDTKGSSTLTGASARSPPAPLSWISSFNTAPPPNALRHVPLRPFTALCTYMQFTGGQAGGQKSRPTDTTSEGRIRIWTKRISDRSLTCICNLCLSSLYRQEEDILMQLSQKLHRHQKNFILLSIVGLIGCVASLRFFSCLTHDLKWLCQSITALIHLNNHYYKKVNVSTIIPTNTFQEIILKWHNMLEWLNHE